MLETGCLSGRLALASPTVANAQQVEVARGMHWGLYSHLAVFPVSITCLFNDFKNFKLWAWNGQIWCAFANQEHEQYEASLYKAISPDVTDTVVKCQSALHFLRKLCLLLKFQRFSKGCLISSSNYSSLSLRGSNKTSRAIQMKFKSISYI